MTTHVSAADPYCPDLRRILLETGREQGLDIRDGGTVVVIQGPRFSTRAESTWFSAMGWGVINMTAYPEGWLARELGLCYANVSLITDYDVGLEDDASIEPVSHEAVVEVFTENNDRLRRLLFESIPRIGAAAGRHLRERARRARGSTAGCVRRGLRGPPALRAARRGPRHRLGRPAAAAWPPTGIRTRSRSSSASFRNTTFDNRGIGATPSATSRCRGRSSRSPATRPS